MPFRIVEIKISADARRRRDLPGTFVHRESAERAIQTIIAPQPNGGFDQQRERWWSHGLQPHPRYEYAIEGWIA